tara:strand:+ start:62 stop:265 length:204 start_codon:yes stop_codon:yes gene_type:complete
MENQEQNLLEHAFINQLETDFNDQEYDAMSEMIQLLIENEDNKKIIVEYLSDTAKENWIEGRTNCRF